MSDTLPSLQELISDAPADIVGQEAMMVVDWLVNTKVRRDGWYKYGSVSNRDTYELAQKYVRDHAKIEGNDPEFAVYTSNPFFVFRAPVTKQSGCRQEEGVMEGLVYSNGGVVISRTPSEQRYYLFIDPKTAEIFNYPQPT